MKNPKTNEEKLLGKIPKRFIFLGIIISMLSILTLIFAFKVLFL